jgi:hypothetical protein
MKSFLSIPLFIALFACNSHLAKTDQKTDADIPPADSAAAGQAKKPMHSTDNDVMIVVNEISDTLIYTKTAFKEIIDVHPELLNEIPKDPDTTYFSLPHYTRFGGEAGQDEYYMLYAYFLKKKNGIERYAERRTRLVDIYLNINSVFATIQHGGTYFGHQSGRIVGYAEYAVYLYKDSEQQHHKNYDIRKQKGLYVRSLRQLVADMIRADPESTEQQKTGRIKELNLLVDNIDKDITDIFYLRQAKEFQNRYYGHY